jgi:hypothetical protein
MDNRMNKFLLLCRALFLCLGLLLPQPTIAAAWTLPAGEIKSFQSAYFYSASDYFDGNGDKQSQNTYKKLESDNLIEYGIFDDFTVGVKLGYVSQKQKQVYGTDQTSGMTDPELSLRYSVWADDNQVISIQPTIKFPLADESALIPLGTGSADGEFRLLYGRGYQWQNRQHYIGFEAAYKHRGGDFVDEIRFDSTFGFNIFDKCDVIIQSFSTISHGGAEGVFSNSVPSDYQAHKGQISITTKLTDKYTLQFGAYKDLHGENSGAGVGYLFSLWTKF